MAAKPRKFNIEVRAGRAFTARSTFSELIIFAYGSTAESNRSLRPQLQQSCRARDENESTDRRTAALTRRDRTILSKIFRAYRNPADRTPAISRGRAQRRLLAHNVATRGADPKSRRRLWPRSRPEILLR